MGSRVARFVATFPLSRCHDAGSVKAVPARGDPMPTRTTGRMNLFGVSLVCLALLAGCAGVSSGSAVSVPLSGPESTLVLPAQFWAPEGLGPFPAVVILHDCSGLGPNSSGNPVRWARLLVARGYAVLIPDSFTARGFPGEVCTNPRRQAVEPPVRARDALAAAAYLRTLPQVDGSRIGLMGGSHGGTTTLLALVRPNAEFAAAVALYPGCGANGGKWAGQ